MTPDRWLTLLSIAVGVLAIIVPVILLLAVRRADRARAEHDRERDRQQAVIDKQADTIQAQRDAIFEYKIAMAQLSPVAELVTRTVESLPIHQPERDGT